jgi:hypothetical protein
MNSDEYFWQGTKVRLRPVREEDAEWHHTARLDSPARQVLQLGIELPTSIEAERATVSRFADCRDVDGVIMLAIDDLDGRPVGGISWHSRDVRHGISLVSAS